MLLHASCVAIDGKAVLLAGPSGCGKSDLALRLIDTGAALVADDQVLLRDEKEILYAAPPDVLAGMMEIRAVGLLRLPFATGIPVALYIELTPPDAPLPRLPEADAVFLLDRPVRRLRLHAFAASAPAKIRAALTYRMAHD